MLAERALLTHMGVLADPFAAGMLTPSMRLAVSLARVMPHSMRVGSVTLAGLAARVSWFDVQVAESLDAGIEQLVMIGAGYDSRAWRFGSPGVQFFELDHAGLSETKLGGHPDRGPGMSRAI